MTVSTSTSTVQYNGDGVTTVLSVPFYFLQNSHLLVQQTNNNVSPPTTVTLALGVGYNVSGAGNETGGTVTLTAAAPTGYITAISRSVPATQLVHYVPNDPFPAATHEQALDQLTMLAQQLLTALGYTVSIPASAFNNGVSAVLPYPSASQFLAWDPTGKFLTNGSPTGVGPGTVFDSMIAAGAAIQGTKLSFIQAGAGAFTRTMQDKNRDVVSVKDYVCNDGQQVKGDGVHDDTTGIQACINANTGATVVFPHGTYLTSAPLTITQGGVTLTGMDGSLLPSIVSNALASDIIQINCGTNTLSGICIANLSLDSTSNKTAGYAINITASHGGSCFWTVISNINTTPRIYSGLNIQSCFYINLNDITIQNIGAGGRGFSFVGVDATSQVESIYGRNLKVAAGVSNGSTYGMYIDNYCQGLYLSQVSLETNGIDVDLYLNNTSGVHANAPFNLWFDQLICDSPKNNGIIITDCTTVRFGNAWTTSAHNSGVFITAGIDIEFQGHSAIANGADGFTIHGGTQIRILGGVCDQNSGLASNTYCGVNVSANVTDFTIRDVDFFRQGSSPHHYADILINGGVSDRYVIAGNRCRGYVTAPISDGGSGINKWVQQNDNYNPRGFSVSQPAVPASGTSVTNATGTDCMVYVVGGTVNNIAVGAPSGSTFTGITATPASVMVPAGGYITVFYTAAPSWKWFGN